MAPKLAPAPAPEPDDVLLQLKGLAGDATDAHESFKKKLLSGALNDPATLAVEVGELFSMFADQAQYAFQAHGDHFEWGSEVDTKLDELDEAMGAGSTLLPEDAARLKLAITALLGALLSKDALSPEVIAEIQKQGNEAIVFIDEVTAEEEDEDEDGETEED